MHTNWKTIRVKLHNNILAHECTERRHFGRYVFTMGLARSQYLRMLRGISSSFLYITAQFNRNSIEFECDRIIKCPVCWWCAMNVVLPLLDPPYILYMRGLWQMQEISDMRDKLPCVCVTVCRQCESNQVCIPWSDGFNFSFVFNTKMKLNFSSGNDLSRTHTCGVLVI